jgi:hypothetical protein
VTRIDRRGLSDPEAELLLLADAFSADPFAL